MKARLGELTLLQKLHWTLSLVIGALLVIGIFFVYSARYVSDQAPAQTLYRRQILWAVVGIVCYALVAAYDFRNLKKLSWWIYGVCLVLLIGVLFVEPVGGATRRIMLFGVGVQPSELAKLAAILLLSIRLSWPDENINGIRFLLETVALVAVPVLLILMEPDLGTAMVFVPTVFVMMFVGGVSLRILGGLVGMGAFFAMLLLLALFLPAKLNMSEEAQERIASITMLRDHQRERIQVFFDPGSDPLETGWTRMQSEIAVGSGGLWGKGYLQGDQNVLGYLPRSVAPTDFIYAVIAEEKGFFGSVVVLGLFALMLLCCVDVGLNTKDKMGRLLCAGVTTMLFCHVFINVAMTVGMMPITGLPLPLLSYGGSFTVTIMTALGVVQSVHIRSQIVRMF